jgi:hypothetical protein
MLSRKKRIKTIIRLILNLQPSIPTVDALKQINNILLIPLSVVGFWDILIEMGDDEEIDMISLKNRVLRKQPTITNELNITETTLEKETKSLLWAMGNQGEKVSSHLGALLKILYPDYREITLITMQEKIMEKMKC